MNKADQKLAVLEENQDVLEEQSQSHSKANEGQARTDKEISGFAQNSDLPIQESDNKTEHNGPRGLEPTRYGDWESKGRCVDF